MQTNIHANNTLSDSEWEELQIEDYQYIELASDVESRFFFTAYQQELGEHVLSTARGGKKSSP